MIEIKICGITNEREIEYLNILKPEYVGFVFTKSKRQVTIKEALKLSKNLSEGIKKVGVFKDNSLEEILQIIKQVPLNIIQLHGKEDEKFIALLKENINDSISLWKALSISDIERYIQSNNSYLIDKFLIDGDNPGSGEVFPIEKISELFIKGSTLEQNNNDMANRFILAGGITPENVVDRIVKTKPIGVDVSSGVEIIDENGIRTKSFEKMKTLIYNVRNFISK